MSDSKSLHDLFVDELKDSYDHEKQLVKALRKMASAASHPDLKAAFTAHLGETQGQIEVLEQVFGMLDLKPKGKHCAGIAGIIEEGGEAIEEMDKSPVLDVALIGGGKRAEHYEIAAYQAMIAMANALGMPDAAEKIQGILDEELACDAKLDALAQQLLPEAASGEADEDEDEGSSRPAGPKAAAKKASAKKTTARR
ncbi:MAG: DUF892 family protein [Gemmatimonadaceae bacterium]